MCVRTPDPLWPRVKEAADHALTGLSAAGGTCQEFSPLYQRLALSEASNPKGLKIRFGAVSIDEEHGMALANRTGALEAGIPSVWAYMQKGSSQGRMVWTGDEAPTFKQLQHTFRSVLDLSHTQHA